MLVVVVVLRRSESSVSRGASRSTSASDTADGPLVDGSSSLSSVLREQTTPTTTTAAALTTRPMVTTTQQPMKTRLDEMIAGPYNRQQDVAKVAQQRPRSYSPMTKRGLTLREAYAPNVQVTVGISDISLC